MEKSLDEKTLSLGDSSISLQAVECPQASPNLSHHTTSSSPHWLYFGVSSVLLAKSSPTGPRHPHIYISSLPYILVSFTALV